MRNIIGENWFGLDLKLGVCNEGDPLLLPVKELVKQEVYTKNSPKNTEIVIAKLGNDAGIIGAAFLGNAK